MSRYFIVGGAGFIGSHFCDRLMAAPDTTAVTIYDNFSSGRNWHIAAHQPDNRFRVVRRDVKDAGVLTDAMAGHDVVIHLASNPDIARALKEEESAVLSDLRQSIGKDVTIKSDVQLHHEQFDVMAV